MDQHFHDTIDQGVSPEGFRIWLARRREPESLKAIALQAIDCYEQSKPEPNSSDLALDVLRSGAAHPRFVVWEVALPLLAQLAERSPRARIRIRSLSTNENAKIRHRSVQYLNDLYPRSFCVDLLGSLLTDRSFKVRGFAAGRIEALNLVEMLPAMNDALLKEQNATARFEIEFSMCLLRDNYFEYNNRNGYNLVLRFADRWPRRIVWPGQLTREQVHAVGIDRIRDQMSESTGHRALLEFRRSWSREFELRQDTD